MKKRIACLLLAIILCVSICAIQASAADFVNTGWLWPVDGCYKMSRAFWPADGSGHNGIDIMPSSKTAITPVRAAKAGTVKTVYSGCINSNACSGSPSGDCSHKGCIPYENGKKASFSTISYNNQSYKICNYGFGNGLVISHDNADQSEYAHMESVIVSPGDSIKQGQVIGYMGTSGACDGKHLHFAIKHDGKYVNDTPYGDDYLVTDASQYIGNNVHYVRDISEIDSYIAYFNKTAETVNAYYCLASGKTSAAVRSSPNVDGTVVGYLGSGENVHVSKKGYNGKDSVYWYYIDSGKFAGNYIYSDNVQNVAAHSYGSWITTTAATCTANGSRYRVCTTCGYQQTETIPAVGHSYGTVWKHDDSNHWHECSCGAKSNMGGHNFINGICSQCGYFSKCGDSVYWSLGNGTLTISGTGDMDDFSYPDYAPWYSSRSSIKTVIIKNGVTSIGDYAFRNCASLTSVTIPEGVTSIGAYAFHWCESLESVTIPSSVTSIGDSAFWNCDSLTSVTILEGVTSIG